MKTLKGFLFIFTLLTLFCLHIEVKAQFYNGLQMSFGKSRVQYSYRYWNYYRFTKFDTYFYGNTQDLPDFVARTASKKLNELESFYGHTLERRIIFIIYDNIASFRQSNIGLITGNEDNNIGGVNKIVDNKVFLYYEGDHNKFETQITQTISDLLYHEVERGNSFKDKVANQGNKNIPAWYSKGLISYTAEKWSVDLDNKLKDGILNKKFKRINLLQDDEAELVGHSLWRFVSHKFGEAVLPNIIYMSKINRNIDEGFLFTLGYPLKDIVEDWYQTTKEKYEKEDETHMLPDSGQIYKRPRLERINQQVKISPDAKTIAYSMNHKGKYKIYLYDKLKNKKTKIYVNGHKLEQIIDYNYPQLAWHPNGKSLSFFTMKKGEIRFNSYNLERKELKSRLMLYFDQILSFSYSDDGSKMLISGVKEGRTDIYIHNIASGFNQRITNDWADDLDPKFANKSHEIIFSSNRSTDSLLVEDLNHAQLSKFFKLYKLDIRSNTKVLTKLTEDNYSSETKPVSIANNIYTYLSDLNGINNRYIAKHDSGVSFVDTIVHYEYFTKTYPVSDFRRNIESYDINIENLKQADILRNKLRFPIFETKLNTKKPENNQALALTGFKKSYIKDLVLTDSLKKQEKKILEAQLKKKKEKQKTKPIVKQIVINPDSVDIDINNYVFELEKKQNQTFEPSQDTGTIVKTTKLEKPQMPEKRAYLTSFYPNYLVSQFDYSTLSNSYQPFTGQGDGYFNPDLSGMFKLGVQDLFEDYKVTGGFRLGLDLSSNEYLLSVENISKQLDKEIIYHRQNFKQYSDVYTSKNISQSLNYILKYPFSEVSSVKLSLAARYDQRVITSYDKVSLVEPNVERIWMSTKLEYIYDNSKKIGLNLYDGIRSKAWIEVYEELTKAKSTTLIVGADFRWYFPIHRNFIWASRLATSTSFGSSKLLYYLGAVDSWMNFNSNIPTFDASTNIDQSENYAFQTNATNLRGFSQNARNGNSFCLMNTELRFPLIKYFINRPMSSEFWSNLQLIGFFDAGSAWNGLSPWSSRNEYNDIIIQQKPVTVTVHRQRTPFVAGYGFGFRSKLLGYFIKTDWAWGVENNMVLPRIFYLSLGFDF